MIELALLTAVIGIADEINTARRAKTPTPEQLQMRMCWAKNQQLQNTFKNKLAEFDKSLANRARNKPCSFSLFPQFNDVFTSTFPEIQHFPIS